VSDERPLTSHFRPDGKALALGEYRAVGGYDALASTLKTKSPQDVLDAIRASNLRGRGGAGFPAGIKWAGIPKKDHIRSPRYLIADADEMEPGAFKDRLLMERNPHLLIEGMILASYAIEAEFSFIFIRWEYTESQRRLRRAIGEAYGNNLLGRNILGSGFNLDMHVHVSAGRYICGEGTALLESLEGNRALPRAKVPRPIEAGLWGRPTLMNNVETICNVPPILKNGPDWYKSIGIVCDPGTKLFGVSGRVKKPGAWELPMGTTAREIIEKYAGGMQDGYKLRGWQPGGASTDFLIEEHLDLPMDFDSIQKAGSRLGTGTIIVLDDKTCPVGMTHNLEKFFAHESCGWCTPCREGLPWTASILEAIEEGRGEPDDLPQLERLTRMMAPGRTFCALAPGAMEPLQSALKYFREDFDAHIREKKCPWR
jgi:NADH-quinone oxidoreductase subunit F